MKKRHVVLLALIVCLALGAGAPGRGEQSPQQQLVYSEDFSSDPGYDSLNSLYAFWDAVGASYFACSLDVDSGYGYYMAYSPGFPIVVGDFTVAFDFVILAPDWGCYPGIVFQNTDVPDPEQPDGYEVAFCAKYSWSDHVPRRFMLQSQHGVELLSDSSPTVGEWYRFVIAYYSSSQTVDWTVESLDSGVVFHQVSGASFPISTGFNRLYIGEISQPPSYGEHSAIRIDDIEVFDGIVPVERSSWGVIKASYR